MFINLTNEEKEDRFEQILSYSQKIKNPILKKVAINILNDKKDKIFKMAAGNDGIEGRKVRKTHHCYEGGLLDHTLSVTKHAYNIGKLYSSNIDMDLIIFGAIFHDIGKIEIFDEWNEESEVKANLNFSYLLVDHVYIGQKIVEDYLNKENITDKFKYQVLHMIATHMDTFEKHMIEAHIVSYADSIDAHIQNMINYPRNEINPLYDQHIYMSENDSV
ncbi:MAG: HD domain-containing protein [Clostridia bacterium]|jgi:3'-5' exoribonuclease|nr:HD domain-containing protein [Clostridia bacterium]